MVEKHVFEALSGADRFSEPSPHSRALLVLLQEAQRCVRLLQHLGMSKEGAVREVSKLVEQNPLSLCESPIEEMMMAALAFADWRPFMSIPPGVLCAGKKKMPKGDLIIAPQFNFGPFRLDFLVIGRVGGDEKWINVECDGDEHHNGTIDQFESGRERNKFMRESGIEVIRFRGAEIWKQPAACAHEAATILIDWARNRTRCAANRRA